MANSEIQKRIEADIYAARRIEGSELDASVCASESGSMDGLRSPSGGSSVSQVQPQGLLQLLDPVVAMNAMVTCGATAGEAALVLQSYYSACASVESPSASMVSDQSGMSNKQLRVKRWAEGISELTERSGYCYLHVVRYSRRPHFSKVLGACPTMNDFISLLEYRDLDVANASEYSVYRLPNLGSSMAVRYHIALQCDDGVRVGSVLGVVSCMLRSYPTVNRIDLRLPADETVQSIPRVGSMVYYAPATKVEKSINSSGLLKNLIDHAVNTDCIGERDSRAHSSVFEKPSLELGITEVKSTYDVLPLEKGNMLRIPGSVGGVSLWFFQEGAVDSVESYGKLRSLSPCGVQVIMRRHDSGSVDYHASIAKRTACFVLHFKHGDIRPYALLDELRDTGWLHVAAVDDQIDITHCSAPCDMRAQLSVDRYGFLQLFRGLKESFDVLRLSDVDFSHHEFPFSIPSAVILEAKRRAFGVQASLGLSLDLDPELTHRLARLQKSVVCQRLMDVSKPVYNTYPLQGVDGFVYGDKSLTSLVTVTVCTYQAGQQVAILRPEQGADVHVFEYGSVREVAASEAQSEMLHMSFRDPCVFVKHHGYGSNALLVDILEDTVCVCVHYDTDAYVLTDLAIQIRDAGLLHVASVDEESDLDDYFYNVNRLSPVPSCVLEGSSILYAEIARLCNVRPSVLSDCND